ncbi:hypothetical protein CEXT_535041 [Caerostris extrusa]|uniref:Uncharacterized protein n=1 Tax=Caerostris extrusa TaxID=172846 RepID=A0AAV4P615_CAEEX|nr:hypothetical protein CEXT_535041 [Caerostris extrusa]
MLRETSLLLGEKGNARVKSVNLQSLFTEIRRLDGECKSVRRRTASEVTCYVRSFPTTPACVARNFPAPWREGQRACEKCNLQSLFIEIRRLDGVCKSVREASCIRSHLLPTKFHPTPACVAVAGFQKRVDSVANDTVGAKRPASVLHLPAPSTESASQLMGQLMLRETSLVLGE